MWASCFNNASSWRIFLLAPFLRNSRGSLLYVGTIGWLAYCQGVCYEISYLGIYNRHGQFSKVEFWIACSFWKISFGKKKWKNNSSCSFSVHQVIHTRTSTHNQYTSKIYVHTWSFVYFFFCNYSLYNYLQYCSFKNPLLWAIWMASKLEKEFSAENTFYIIIRNLKNDIISRPYIHKLMAVDQSSWHVLQNLKYFNRIFQSSNLFAVHFDDSQCSLEHDRVAFTNKAYKYKLRYGLAWDTHTKKQSQIRSTVCWTMINHIADPPQCFILPQLAIC